VKASHGFFGDGGKIVFCHGECLTNILDKSQFFLDNSKGRYMM
jgi:hypothetical protein